jgi:clan AA aspartic protease (TIGR02281 family)
MKNNILLLFILLNINVFADSPITSTAFYLAFNEIPQVNKARELGKLNYELAEFLSNMKNPIDQKLAVVNALGWSVEGKNNRSLFEIFLKKKYSVSTLNYTKISSDEHLLIGYLAILDNYLDVVEPLQILTNALKRNPNSYSYNLIYGLALSQISLDFDVRGVKENEKFLLEDATLKKFIDFESSGRCNIYLINAKIDSNKLLKQDFRVSAKKFVFDYIGIYQFSCSDEELVVTPSLDKYIIEEGKIKLTKKNGVFELPVKINGKIDVSFILDSGASDVHIPQNLFNKMIELGQIKKEDIIGKQTYSIADGSTVENVKFYIRKIEIGNFSAENVEASVGNDKSPLLLGQSFLQKFESYSIDIQSGFIELIPIKKNNLNENFKDN